MSKEYISEVRITLKYGSQGYPAKGPMFVPQRLHENNCMNRKEVDRCKIEGDAKRKN